MAEPDLDRLSRQRIDFEEHPDGSVTAILTVTLPNGQAHRYTETVTPEEYDQFANVVASAEARMLQRVEGLSDEEVAGLFSSIGKAFKSVVNGVKKFAASKIFKTAASGLQTIAPALGPYAPAAMAVGGGMQVASKVARGAIAAEAGAKQAAKALGIGAHNSASYKTRGKPALTRAVTSWANRKRKNVFSMLKSLGKKRRFQPTRSRKALPKSWAKRKTSRKPQRITVLAAAKKGRLRSNKPGDVSAKQLQQLAKKGRVFWIQTA